MNEMHDPEQDALLATGPAADRLGISQSTLRAYAVRGLIQPTILPSGRLRWRVSDLDKLIGRES